MKCSAPGIGEIAAFSINDVSHALHYLLKMLEAMQWLDRGEPDTGGAGELGRPALFSVTIRRVQKNFLNRLLVAVRHGG